MNHRDLQNYLAKQSEDLRELCDYKARLNQHVSLLQDGMACSSPSSSSSEHFNFPLTWKNLSNTSIFAEDSNLDTNENDQTSHPFKRKHSRETDIDENMINTEFVSLPTA